MKTLKTPNVLSFVFGGVFWVGYSKEMLQKMARPTKGYFLQYPDGEVQCLRCGNNQSFGDFLDFPTFVFVWDCEQLRWVPHWGYQHYSLKTLFCSNCDRIPCLDSQAVICFSDHLPERCQRREKTLFLLAP